MSELTPLECRLIAQLRMISTYLDGLFAKEINTTYNQNYSIELELKNGYPIYVLSKDGKFAANFYTFIEVVSYLDVCKKFYHKQFLEANKKVNIV